MSNRQTGASRDRRPLLASLVLAWLGLAGLCFSLDVELGSHRVTFLWSLALPLIATLAYGWRAALLVAGPGLCALFPFVLWPTNGWANLVGMLEYGGWFLAHGLGAQARDRRPAWWNHPYAVQLAYTPVYLLLSLGPFAYSFTCNPPFWYPAAATGISGEVLWTITVKSLISLFAMTVLAEAMFRSASLRTLLGLPVEPCQRNSGRTVLLALAIGISLFGIRQWLNHALFVHDAAHPLAFHKEDALDLILFSLGGLMAGSLIAGYHVKARSATRAMQLTQHAFAQSLSATSIAGPDGRLTQANPSFLKLWNYREAVDVIGQPIATFLQDPGTARTILETLNRQGTWEGAFYYPHLAAC
jgi:PAS domain-containing protein